MIEKKKARILIVEDERIVAEDIEKSLDNLGYQTVGVASSGKEAVRLASKRRPDLVLMDIVLRDEQNGIETARQIDELYNLPVVFLTAYADEETLDRAKRTKPYGYILKPFDDRELQTTIEMALYKCQMEAKVKESEAWLLTTLKSIGDAVITTDTRGLVTFINPVAEQVTGWSSAEAVGNPLNRVFKIENETTGKAVANPTQKVLKPGQTVGVTDRFNLIDRTGKKIPIDDSSAPIVDTHGRTVGVVLVFQDITQRRLAEAALKQSEEEKRMILRSVSELVIYQDLNHRILWVNRADSTVTPIQTLGGQSIRGDIFARRSARLVRI